MAPVDDLSPDQRAVLQLLLKQGKRYEQLGALLRVDAGAVRARAVGALEALAPAGVELPAGRRAELSDWLLGQQDPAESAQTLEYLGGSPAACDWAATVSDELREGGYASGALPDVPGEGEASARTEAPAADAAASESADAAATPDSADAAASTSPTDRFAAAGIPGAGPAAAAAGTAGAPPDDEARLPGFAPAANARQPASRVGGALLLAGIVIVLAVALVWALASDDDAGGGGATGSVAQTTATTGTTPAAEPEITGQVNLRAPGGGEALGVANVLAQGDQRAVAIQGQDLRPNTKRDAYAVWLTNGPEGAVSRLGFAPAVGKKGRLEGATALPEDAAEYGRLVISRETDANPESPGTVVLSGKLDLS